jgi:hypothetical protein
MKRVTGIGGIFFKADDPDKLRSWYRVHVGIESEKEGGAIFKWRKADEPTSERCTVWSPFPADTAYFAPSPKPFMINLQVENLDEILTQLKAEGVDVDPKVESYDYGKFGWIIGSRRKPDRTLGTKGVVAAVSAAKEEQNQRQCRAPFIGESNWAVRVSNPRPSRCKRDALPLS